MTSPYEIFKSADIDTEKVLVLDYTSFEIHIKYGGSQNRSFANAAKVRMKPLQRQQRLAEEGRLSDEALKEFEKRSARIMAEIYADHVIVGWKGVKDENGENLTYNRDNVIKLLTDLPELFDDIAGQAADAGNFKEEQDKESEKNSRSSSDGS